VSSSEAELHHESSRCLLDCLCKDEMKCCKSVAKMNDNIASALLDVDGRDRHNKQLTVRSADNAHCLNKLTTRHNNKQHQQHGGDDDDDDDEVGTVGRTYCSLPNIVPYSQHSSSQDTSQHSLRTKPSDTIYRIQVNAVYTVHSTGLSLSVSKTRPTTVNVLAKVRRLMYCHIGLHYEFPIGL